MYQALYRKWRPRTFDDVVGQEHITETLKNQVQTGHLSHAYLFVGTRGTGKTTCAKILAKAVNCEHPVNGNPCNECANCRGIDDGSILDVLELDAASNNSVDNVRALRDEAVFSPVSAKKRVYIIDEVHMLSNAAFNALLKILEEPPEHLLFILATTELQKVPATILSRCQRYSFKRILPDALAGRIRFVAQQEGMDLSPDAADLLSALADGSLRDGLSLLDQCAGYEQITAENVLSAMGLAGSLRIADLLEKIDAGDTQAALAVFTELWQDGKSPASLLRELSSLLRDTLMRKIAPTGGGALLSGSFSKETLQTLSARMTQEELLCALDTVQAHIASLRDGRDPKTTAELCIVMLSQPQLGNSLDTLKARVARLENAIAGLPVQNMHRNISACSDSTDISVSETVRSKTAKADKSTASPAASSAALADAGAPLEGDAPPFDLAGPPAETVSSAPEISTEKASGADPIRPQPSAPEAPAHTPDDATPVSGDSASAFSGGDNGELWTAVKKELAKTMNRGQLSIIDHQTQGSFDGTLLTIGVPNTFARGQLEQGTALALIRSAAEAAAGHPVPVKVILSEGGQSVNAEQLKADLSQFGNVKFE